MECNRFTHKRSLLFISIAGDPQEIPDFIEGGGGLGIPVSGSPSSIYSDPGIISCGGVRDKRSIVQAAVTPTKSKLPRFLKASPGGSKRDKTGFLINSAAHQIQLHLTPPLDGRRRHSLERYNPLVSLLSYKEFNIPSFIFIKNVGNVLLNIQS